MSSSSGSSATQLRRQSWRLRCRRLRTPLQQPSSSYHNWTESTHGGTRRLADTPVGLFCVCVQQCLAVMDELMERLVYPVRATEGDKQTYRQTDEGMHPAGSSPLRLFLFLSAASVCTLIKTLNLPRNTDTHARTLMQAHAHTHPHTTQTTHKIHMCSLLPSEGQHQRPSLLLTHFFAFLHKHTL